MSNLSSEERKRLHEAERALRQEIREQERLHDKAVDGLKRLINQALDAGQEPSTSLMEHAKATKLDYEAIYQEVLEERKEEEKRDAQRKKEKELRAIIMQYVSEKTKLSRAEMRAEILLNYNVPMATYVKVESQTLEETYSSWIAGLVQRPQEINRECLDNLARLLDKNVDKDVQDFVRKQEIVKHELQKKATIKKIIWGVSVGLIVLQIVFWGWWTILTGLITLAIAGVIHLFFLD